MKQLFFLAGLPRSGSTVLANILCQRPDTYVTPTSPLLDQLIVNQNIWHSLQTVKANPIPKQLENITLRMMYGFWDHIDKPIIIDKNRGWSKNLPVINMLTNTRIKMIMTTRDLPSIIASWITLHEKNGNIAISKLLQSKGLECNKWNIAMEMWEFMVKDCVEMQNFVINSEELQGQYLLVEYEELVSDPKKTLSNIEEFLCLEKHEYDFNNIDNVHKCDDLAAWGISGMHETRQVLKKTAKSPEEVLGDDLMQFFKFR